MNVFQLSALLVLSFVMGCQAPEPQNDVVYLRLGADIQRINPMISGDAYSRQVEELIYQPLFQFNTKGDSLQAVLAAGIPEIQSKGKQQIFTFKIKEEARWADGASVTGKDVQFTFRQIFNPYLPTHGFRSYLQFLDSIVVDSANPKRFSCYTNSTYFLTQTVLSNIEIFPAHFHDPAGILQGHVVDDLKKISNADNRAELKGLADSFIATSANGELLGSGPYRLDNWQRGDHVLLKRDDNYWGLSADNSDWLQGGSQWINFRIILDAQSAWQSFQARELDVYNEVPDEIYRTACSDHAAVQCLAPTQNLYYYIGLNRQQPGLRTAEMRKAVAHCLDIDSWIDQHLNGLAVRVDNPIAPSKKYYLPSPSPRFAPEAAQASFDKAGWIDTDGDGLREKTVNGKRQAMRLRLAFVAANSQARQLGLFFKAQAAKLGLEIVLQPLDFATLRANLRSGDFDLFYLANYDPPADLDPRNKWHTASIGGANYVGFGTAESDRLIEQIGITSSPAERAAQYQKFQQMIFADQPYIFLFSPQQKILASEDISLIASQQWPGYRAQSVRRKR